jgi:hypothetical protein
MGSLAPNDLVFPLCWGLEEFHPACLYGEDVSLGDSLKSLLEIGVSNFFSFN